MHQSKRQALKQRIMFILRGITTATLGTGFIDYFLENATPSEGIPPP
jgi:hypothetical protein